VAGDTAHCEVLVVLAGVVALAHPNNHALENLDTFAVTFNDSYMDLHRCAGAKLREATILCLEGFD
jgi:hypothetical protein